MSKRRVIKKVEMEFDPSIDEMLWPIYVALVVLGSYLVGIVLALCRFDAADPSRNAITWLIAIPAVCVVAAILFNRIESRLVRRGVLLSALLSLIIHVTLLLAMFFTNIFGSGPPEPIVSVPERPREEITVPAMPIPLPADQRAPQDHERPVESGEPEEADQATLEPEQQSPTIDIREELAEPEQTESIDQPTPQIRRQVTETVPRRAESKATISRSQLLTRPQVATGSTQSQQPATNTEMTPTRPRETNVAKRQSPMLPQRQTVDQPESTTPAAIPRVARRQPEDAPFPSAKPSPALPRSFDRPRATPRTSITQTDRPSTPKQTSEESLTPSATAERRQPTSPVAERSSAEPAPESHDLAARQAPRQQQPADANPELAASTAPSDRRNEVSVRPDFRNELSQPNAIATAETQQPQPGPSAASQVARRSTAPASRQSATPTDQPRPSTPTVNSTARVNPETQPTVSSRPLPTPQPRVATEANVVSSPTPVNAPSESTLVGQSATQPQPSATAMSQARQGIAGVGAAENLDQSVPAPSDLPPTIASASARRVNAAQDEAGPAIAPQQVSRTRQTRAGAAAPNAVMPATDTAVAQVVGSETPSDLQASSSAATSDDRANVQRGVTASPGPAEVDLGPTRIVANTGQGRASGGGQPTLSFEPSSNEAVRRSASAGMRPSVAATNIGDVAQSPPDGGQAENQEEPTASTSAITSRTNRTLPSSSAAGERVDGEATASPSAPTITANTPSRAASIDAPQMAISEAGGGTERPSRQLLQRPSAVLKPAEEVDVAGLLESSGDPDGSNLQAQGVSPTRSAAGLAGPINDSDVGNLADEVAMDGPSDLLNRMIAAMERSSASDEDGPSPADLTNLGGPIGRATNVPVPSVQANEVASNLDFPSDVLGADEGGVEQVADAQSGPMSKQTSGSLPVEVSAPQGPGGLAADRLFDVGLMTRQAQAESNVVAFHSTRFLRSDVGRPLPVSTDVATSTPAFKRRQQRRGEEPDGGDGRPSPKTEAAIELGLVYLANNQQEDGHWSLQKTASGRPENPKEKPALKSDAAATGLSLLCYLGAGYHHKEDQYADVIRGGLEFLIQNQREDGSLFVPHDRLSNQSGWMYSHAIATIALCEAYGMTQDAALKEPSQRAINFIVESQHPERGGWRYRPRFGSDTSVTGWMMMALKSGRLAKLDVPEKAFDEINAWLDFAQASPEKSHLYRYNPHAPINEKQSHGRNVSRTMTAVGLLMRLYSGWSRDREVMKRGADYLLQSKPALGIPARRKRDTYYWYYATQVMFHMGGDYWQQWNDKLHPLLIKTQEQEGQLAGSWHPLRPVADRWGPHAGRLYVTTMNLLSLEVYYRHLPLYEDTAK